MNDFKDQLVTECIGRYLIDMPRKTALLSDLQINSDVRIDATPMSKIDFLDEMERLELSYKAIKHIHNYQVLFEISEPDGEYSKLFVRLEDIDSSETSRYLEAYKWNNGYTIKLISKASDNSAEKFKDDKLAMLVGTTLPKKRATLIALLKQVRGRDRHEIPTGPGTCFDGGFLAGKAHDLEIFSGAFALVDKQDVQISFDSHSRYYVEKTLLERSSEFNGDLARYVGIVPGGRIIREQKITVNGMPAEEWLMAGETNLHIPGHHFILNFNERQATPQAPFLELDMTNGDHSMLRSDHWYSQEDGKLLFKTASLTENEALSLWELVSRSLRVRPGAY